MGAGKRWAGAIVVGIAALGLSACGSESNFDQDQVESEVISLAAEPPDPIEAESAECPTDLQGEDGETFTCTLTTAEGEEYEVGGEFVGDEGTFNITSQELVGGTTGAEGAE